ncbi:hypothetical protein C8A00DRAFT_36191 [Chaetomidium leptoderma]|uniref:G-protein coupled receptors family 2 profile 2 domain-containing protein n=1 Tax=Chaetomidium leptoderma TaxID=669021 RepID=A0AAN6VGP3_9PEZI|nr:hypothetical protein C8A00DRAFT_36191 [Chaetomidium leptoderma]
MDGADPGLADSVVDAFSIIERVCSVFSLLGSMLVITTFSLSKAFHKPINRLVFYATIGNLMTNVATLIARSFIGDVNSAGCQLQAFLIQMFMPADAFWILAMAVNVYLTFYFKFDAQRLRKMEIPYFLLCYGVPFIVALVLVFVSSPEKGRMYGNATLWCWIAPKWDIYRIAIFYGPVWISILITCFIYIRAGREIYLKHRQLKEFSTSLHDPEPLSHAEDLFSSTKTTEVFVTTEVMDKTGSIDLAPLGAGERRRSQILPPQKPTKAAYSVTISSNRNGDVEGQQFQPSDSQGTTAAAAGTTTTTVVGGGGGRASAGDGGGGGERLDRTTTTNSTKVHTITAAGHNPNNPNQNPLRRRAAYEANNATWSYTKCALLFFTAMLVTWIPSSANRVYSLIHPGEASLALEYMSAFVLPLQGFWNAIIYVVTSWGACKMLWEDVRSWCGASSRRRRRRGLHDPHELMSSGGGDLGGNHGGSGSGGGVGLHMHHRSAFQMMGKGGDGKSYETESMTELAASRPGSSDSPTMGLESESTTTERGKTSAV